MNLENRLDELHSRVKSNKWFRYFATFNRIALAAGFIPSGFTKIFDERFTSLSVNHPMGNYLEALYHTGYYYPFIGYVQVTAAILLLIPRTATLGALLYFPIILNICILSLAVGFEGSLVSSPLMVYANLYLICWDYDKLKFILPFKSNKKDYATNIPENIKDKFPTKFFIGVIVTVALTIFTLFNSYTKMTRNNYKDCMSDCKSSDNTQECFDFCDCIHNQGNSFDKCTDQLKQARKNK
jgi:uncharacterized membrane protein YphA (DoxX/SURF4 family)